MIRPDGQNRGCPGGTALRRHTKPSNDSKKDIGKWRPGRPSSRKKSMVRPERFELPASWFVARRSIQLSYGRKGQNSVISRQDNAGPRLTIASRCEPGRSPKNRRRYDGMPLYRPLQGREYYYIIWRAPLG